MVVTQNQSIAGNVRISENAISQNIQQIHSLVGSLDNIFLVLKANAYGHGIKNVIEQLINHNCTRVAVESVSAACEIRNFGFDEEVLILHPVQENEIAICIEQEFNITVNDVSQLPLLQNECNKLHKICNIHLKLDVGLHRIGSSEEDINKIAETSKHFSSLSIHGIYAHPKCVENYYEEFKILTDAYNRLFFMGIPLKTMHYGDSSILIAHPDIAKAGSRIGTLLYGVLPPNTKKEDVTSYNFIPAMSVKTRILQIHKMKQCETLGYYSHSKMDADSRIAIIPMGYANGLDRNSIHSNINVLVNGKRAPLCGNIFMNS